MKKNLGQNSASIYDKNTFQNVGRERTSFNIIKAIQAKPTDNFIFNGKNMIVFPLISGTR